MSGGGRQRVGGDPKTRRINLKLDSTSWPQRKKCCLFNCQFWSESENSTCSILAPQWEKCGSLSYLFFRLCFCFLVCFPSWQDPLTSLVLDLDIICSVRICSPSTTTGINRQFESALWSNMKEPGIVPGNPHSANLTEVSFHHRYLGKIPPLPLQSNTDSRTAFISPSTGDWWCLVSWL